MEDLKIGGVSFYIHLIYAMDGWIEGMGWDAKRRDGVNDENIKTETKQEEKYGKELNWTWNMVNRSWNNQKKKKKKSPLITKWNWTHQNQTSASRTQTANATINERLSERRRMMKTMKKTPKLNVDVARYFLMLVRFDDNKSQ